MIRNYPFLNHDREHNFLICKKICKKIVKSAKIGVKIQNPENIPKEKRFLLVSNHRCFFDVVFLLASIEETLSFVAAKELWHYPILRKYLDSIGCVALDRHSKKMDKIKESIHSMKTALEGGNLVLFLWIRLGRYNRRVRRLLTSCTTTRTARWLLRST